MPREKPMTVKDLYEECKKVYEAGYGDKKVLISSDDEGNDFHYIWFDFTVDEESVRGCIETSCAKGDDLDLENCVILG